MNDADHFLDVAVRPLAANPELQVHARQELQDKMLSDVDEVCWRVAVEKLEKHDRNGLGTRWRWILLFITIVTVLICFGPSVTNLAQTRDIIKALAGGAPSGGTETEEKSLHRLSRHLSPDDRLILHGDRSKTTPSERLEALWRRYPDQPAYFADYAIAYAMEHKQPPPDFLEIGARIDPGNAWFPLYAAALTAADVVELIPQTPREKKDRSPKTWEILDEARMNEALALMEQGYRMLRFESYQRKRLQQQIELLPPATSPLSAFMRTSFVAGKSTSSLAFRDLSDAISAKAEILANEGKREAFQTLLANTYSVLEWKLEDESSLVDVLVVQASITRSISNLKDAAIRLDLEKEAAALQTLQNRLDSDKTERDTRKAQNSESYSIVNHSGLLAAFTLPMLGQQVRNAPPLDPDRLEPSRRTDHALFGQFAVTGIGILLMVSSLLCMLYRFRHGLVTRFLAARAGRLLSPRDWAWIGGIGCVLPVLSYPGIYHLTPLGGIGWSYQFSRFGIPAIQVNVWAFLTIAAPLVAIRWRLKRRLIGFHLNLPNLTPSWVILAATACALPIAGIGYVTHSPNVEIGAACVVLSISQVWWMALMTKALLGKNTHAMGRQAISHVLVPTYLFSLCLIAGLQPIYRIQVRHWVARDNLMAVTPEKPSMSAYEYEVTQTRKAELLEILAPLREIQ